jgi:hypothetical protein
MDATLRKQLGQVGQIVDQQARQLAEQEAGRVLVHLDEWLRNNDAHHFGAEVYGSRDGASATFAADIDQVVSGLRAAIIRIRQPAYEKRIADQIVTNALREALPQKEGNK